MTGADAQQFARAAAGRKDDLTSDCCCRRVARLARVRKRDKYASTPWSGAFINLKKQSQGDFGRSFGTILGLGAVKWKKAFTSVRSR